MECPCNLVPPRGVHSKECEFYKDSTEKWSEYVKTLPDDVRLGLAEYAAQQFLEGVEKGKHIT